MHQRGTCFCSIASHSRAPIRLAGADGGEPVGRSACAGCVAKYGTEIVLAIGDVLAGLCRTRCAPGSRHYRMALIALPTPTTVPNSGRPRDVSVQITIARCAPRGARARGYTCSRSIRFETWLTSRRRWMIARLASICPPRTPACGTRARYLVSTSSQAIPQTAAPFGTNTVLVLARPSVVRIVTVAPCR